MSLHDNWNNKDNIEGSEVKVVPQVLLIHSWLHVGCWTPERDAVLSDYLPSISSLMMENQQLHPDWLVVEGQQHQDWSSHLSPEHASAWHLIKGTGTPSCALVPHPTNWSGASRSPWRQPRTPVCGSQAPDAGAHTDSSAFWGFGKINRPPLSSAFERQRPGVFKLSGFCRRRKEQQIIPLQVSLSVATLHFQSLGKVTSALDKPVQEAHKQHRFKTYVLISQQLTFLLSLVELRIPRRQLQTY